MRGAKRRLLCHPGRPAPSHRVVTTPPTPTEAPTDILRTRAPRQVTADANLAPAVFVLAFLGVLALFAFVEYALEHTLRVDPNHRADWASAFFSALAFAGLLLALFLQGRQLELQREELAEQRRELALTRAEVAGQRAEMEEQNETLRVQRFESAFYHLLRLFRETATRAEEELRRLIYGSQHMQAAMFESIASDWWGKIATMEMYPTMIEKGQAAAGAEPRGTHPPVEAQRILEAQRIIDRVINVDSRHISSALKPYFGALWSLATMIAAAKGVKRLQYAQIVAGLMTDSERRVTFFYAMAHHGETWNPGWARLLAESHLETACFASYPEWAGEVFSRRHKEDERMFPPAGRVNVPGRGEAVVEQILSVRPRSG